MEKTWAILLLLAGMASAIPIATQGEILRSARVSDIANYYEITGVVLQDTPIISPFFACLRANIYKGYQVDGALMVDRVSCQPASYYVKAWQGIQMCNAGNRAGNAIIGEALLYPVSYSC